MKTAEITAMPAPEPISRDAASTPIHGVSRFLTRRDVAKLFGVSASTITRWARTGLIAAVRTPGGHYRYRFDEIARAARTAARIDA
jgi:excisionase family DNA binding protein